MSGRHFTSSFAFAEFFYPPFLLCPGGGICCCRFCVPCCCGVSFHPTSADRDVAARLVKRTGLLCGPILIHLVYINRRASCRNSTGTVQPGNFSINLLTPGRACLPTSLVVVSVIGFQDEIQYVPSSETRKCPSRHPLFCALLGLQMSIAPKDKDTKARQLIPTPGG